MSFSLGIVGLPNVGKSTLFNAITQCEAEASNYPFCTIDPNVGVVLVPDKRLDQLAEINKSKKIVPAVIEFVDIAGLVKGASKGEGLGNQFLANIREVKVILHVVRCFEDPNIIHVSGKIDPLDDIGIINLELIMSDLSTLEKRIAAVAKRAKQNKDDAFLLTIYEKIKDSLERGLCVRQVVLSEDEKNAIKDLNLLTQKKVIYVANVAEKDIAAPFSNEYVQKVQELAMAEKSAMVVVSSKIEEEISQLPPEEAKEFFQEMGIRESGLHQLIHLSYAELDLITYLTSGEKETRAWTIKKGIKAPQAAGVIHTDFEKGFIKAEIISFDKYIEAKSLSKAREMGYLRMEGKDYVMQDGDVVEFKFNV